MRLNQFFAVALVLALSSVTTTAGVNNDGGAGQVIDLTNAIETFSETFRGPLDVTPNGPSRWTAHTPWHGDFGDAVFADPEPGFPFQTGPDGLTITARKTADGQWRSGLLSSVDPQRQGFAQALGYFEARMRMPRGPGTWPAFWLVSHADPDYDAEIDVAEFYGHATSAYQIAAQLWPKSKDKKHFYNLQAIQVTPGSLSDDFHLYGAEITEDFVIMYFDRREVSRVPAAPAMRQPMSILINMALGSGWPIDKTPNPSILFVDYIKVYQRPRANSAQK